MMSIFIFIMHRLKHKSHELYVGSDSISPKSICSAFLLTNLSIIYKLYFLQLLSTSIVVKGLEFKINLHDKKIEDVWSEQA